MSSIVTRWDSECPGWEQGSIFLFKKMKSEKSCLTLGKAMDYIVHGILRARILEWVTFPFSVGSSQPRDQTQVSLTAGRFFTSGATREAQESWAG